MIEGLLTVQVLGCRIPSRPSDGWLGPRRSAAGGCPRASGSLCQRRRTVPEESQCDGMPVFIIYDTTIDICDCSQ